MATLLRCTGEILSPRLPLRASCRDAIGVAGWRGLLALLVMFVLVGNVSVRVAHADQTTTISVPGAQPWTDTGVDILASNVVTIAASGTIHIAGSDPGKTPAGAGTGSCVVSPSAIAPDLPCWSLIGRIDNGTPFEVGTGTTFIASAAGRLFLGVNDNFFGDNSGAWTATITVGTIVTPTGALDSSFGTNGKVFTSFGNHDAIATALAIQPDGKAVVAGYASNGSDNDWVVARYNPDGSLDAGFGSGGTVITDLGGNDVAFAVALQIDGKIVVGGYTNSSGLSHWVLARFNTDGSLDTSFGSGGKVITGLRGGGSTVRGLVIQGDGKIVAAGYSGNGFEDDVTLVRYNTDGSLDNSFGSGGTVTTPIGTFNDRGNALALQPAGKLVVLGDFDAGGHDDIFLARYNTDGSLDTGFGSGGKVITQLGSTAGARGLVIQGDGKIVITGAAINGGFNDTFVARYAANGSLDSSFGSGGIALTSLVAGNDSANSVTLQSDGRIVVAGQVSGTGADWAVTRYSTDGSLDASFGSGGTAVIDLSTGDDEAESIVTLPDGKLVAAGYAFNGVAKGFALVRIGSAATHAAPVTSASVSPSPTSPGVYPGSVTVTLSATAASGFTVANTYSTVDGGAQQTYSSPFIVSGDGSHTIKYWSVDSAGVYEAPNTLTFQIASLTITTSSSLPSGTVGVAYSQTLQASGGTAPYTWAVTVGALPPGLALDAASGVISGIPTTAGTFSFTVQVTDSSSETATQQFTFSPPPPSGSAGSSYSAPISITPPSSGGGGGSSSVCTSYAVISGALPPGLSLDPSTGIVSGTPTTGGTYSFTVQCGTSGGQTATQDFTITINNPSPSLTSLSPGSATTGGQDLP